MGGTYLIGHHHFSQLSIFNHPISIDLAYSIFNPIGALGICATAGPRLGLLCFKAGAKAFAAGAVGATSRSNVVVHVSMIFYVITVLFTAKFQMHVYP